MLVMGLISAALAAGGPATLEVRVTDATGAAVPAGVVTLDIEGVRHRVNRDTGAWSATTLFQAGGSPVPLVAGTTVSFWATAPGLTGARVSHTMAAKPKKDTLVVKLEPLVPPSMPCWSAPPEPGNGVAIAESARVALMSVEGSAQGCALGARAWGLALTVVKMEADYAAAPSDGLLSKIYTARQEAIDATEAWRAWAFSNGDAEVTVPLCVSLRGTEKGCRG